MSKPVSDMSNSEILAEARRREERRAAGLPIAETPAEATARIVEEDARLEREIQAEVVKLYLAFRCMVYNLSQPRATKQTPGLADIYVIHMPSHSVWWHELKTPRGRQSPPQVEFQEVHKYTGVGYVVGGVKAAEAHLIKMAIAMRDSDGSLEPLRSRR
jgi:hypothetical protein